MLAAVPLLIRPIFLRVVGGEPPFGRLRAVSLVEPPPGDGASQPVK